MSDLNGTFLLGPETGRLTVLTGTAGPAAKLGHNLELTVQQWSAMLELHPGGAGKVTLKADGASLRVAGSRGSLQSVSASDTRTIERAIDEKVLKRSTIRFTSASAAADDRVLRVSGSLTLLGTARPLQFELMIDDERNLTGTATFRQSEWGIKPFAVMGGALKVADQVTVTVSGQLEQA